MADLWSDVAYPWGPDVATLAELKSDIDVLKTSVINIVLTRIGERVMLPEFGSIVPDLPFEPADEISVAEVQESVRDAIERWDDRIDVVDVGVETRQNGLDIKVLFRSAKDPLVEPSEVVIPLASQ